MLYQCRKLGINVGKPQTGLRVSASLAVALCRKPGFGLKSLVFRTPTALSMEHAFQNPCHYDKKAVSGF